MLSSAGVARGELPVKGYDIHCPLMGGQGLNYLGSSCRGRLAQKTCRLTSCSRFQSATKAKRPNMEPVKAVAKIKSPAQVEPPLREPEREPTRMIMDQADGAKARDKKPAGKPSKHKIGPCANPECKRVMPLPGRGLCGKCYSAALKAERSPAPRVVLGAVAGDQAGHKLVISFVGEDVKLFERLLAAARSSRRAMVDQVLFLIEEALPAGAKIVPGETNARG